MGGANHKSAESTSNLAASKPTVVPFLHCSEKIRYLITICIVPLCLLYYCMSFIVVLFIFGVSDVVLRHKTQTYSLPCAMCLHVFKQARDKLNNYTTIYLRNGLHQQSLRKHVIDAFVIILDAV